MWPDVPFRFNDNGWTRHGVGRQPGRPAWPSPAPHSSPGSRRPVLWCCWSRPGSRSRSRSMTRCSAAAGRTWAAGSYRAGGTAPRKGDELPLLAGFAADAAFTPAAITRVWQGRHHRGGRHHLPVVRPFSIQSDRAGNTPAAGCPPAVSAPEGHGMILIERCVDLEDTTYRVMWIGLGP